MSGKFSGDFVPGGMKVIDGKLVKAPPDPYVTIEQLKRRIADLERAAANGESLDLQVANANLRKELAAAENARKEAETRLAGADRAIADLQGERDSLKEANAILTEKLAKASELPPVTPEMQAAADANRAADQAAIDAAAASDDGKTSKGKSRKG